MEAELENMIAIIQESPSLPDEEKAYRIKNLQRERATASAVDLPSPRFYQLIHEVKALQLLESIGTVKPSMDSKSVTGADFLLNDKEYVECVCTSEGNNGLLSKHLIRNQAEGIPYDYSEKEDVLFQRLSQALQEKRKFCNTHQKNGSIPTDAPYIIFVGLGPLAYEMFAGDYGKYLTGVLLGVHNLTYVYDNERKKIVGAYHAHRDYLKKINAQGETVSVPCNLFRDAAFACVSAVLFTNADFRELYTNENTWLFLNPFATNPVKDSAFSQIVTWSRNSDNEYFPSLNGKAIR